MQKDKKRHKNNRLKISAPTWNETFQLPEGLYSVSGIKGYFEYILKKHHTVTDNSPIRIYVNKIENTITFKIKTSSYLELLTPETMKLLRCSKTKITENENEENLLYLKMK